MHKIENSRISSYVLIHLVDTCCICPDTCTNSYNDSQKHPHPALEFHFIHFYSPLYCINSCSEISFIISRIECTQRLHFGQSKLAVIQHIQTEGISCQHQLANMSLLSYKHLQIHQEHISYNQ